MTGLSAGTGTGGLLNQPPHSYMRKFEESPGPAPALLRQVPRGQIRRSVGVTRWKRISSEMNCLTSFPHLVAGDFTAHHI